MVLRVLGRTRLPGKTTSQVGEPESQDMPSHYHTRQKSSMRSVTRREKTQKAMEEYHLLWSGKVKYRGLDFVCRKEGNEIAGSPILP